MNIFSFCFKKNKNLKKFIFEKDILRKKLDIVYYLNLTNHFYYIKELVTDKLEFIEKESKAKVKKIDNKSTKKVIKKNTKLRQINTASNDNIIPSKEVKIKKI